MTIKPTSGGDKFQAEVETSATVRELKEEVARKSDTPADQQRLIYKGQVLKDDKTVESYGMLVVLTYTDIDRGHREKQHLCDRLTKRACPAYGQGQTSGRFSKVRSMHQPTLVSFSSCCSCCLLFVVCCMRGPQLCYADAVLVPVLLALQPLPQAWRQPLLHLEEWQTLA